MYRTLTKHPSGQIGLRAFHALLHALTSPSSPFHLERKIPLVLETPLGPAEDTKVWRTEIGVLNRLVGMESVAAKEVVVDDGEEKEEEEKEEEKECVEGSEDEVRMEELVEEVRSVVRKGASKR